MWQATKKLVRSMTSTVMGDNVNNDEYDEGDDTINEDDDDTNNEDDDDTGPNYNVSNTIVD
ncbi:hypothetical protein LINPERHAP1_LOCUS5755 [Linum perenne]